MNKKTKQSRSEVAMWLAIVLGLILGMLIKRVRLGILLGLFLAGLIVFTGWLRNSRKD
jgi:Kef-type K+ transport system membrane component KefB